MDISEILAIALPAVFVLVGVALVWFIIELVSTVRKARSTINSLETQLQPTLKSVEKITASLEPAALKVDPLVERVSLTVDAVNLEMMRVDKILEDATEVTGSISSAVQTVDEVASAPLELVTSLTGKIRNVLKPQKGASSTSISLGEQKAATDHAKPRKGVVVQKVDEAPLFGRPTPAAAPSQSKTIPDIAPIHEEVKEPLSEEDRITQILEAAQESIERQGDHVKTAATSTPESSEASSYFTYTDSTNEEK